MSDAERDEQNEAYGGDRRGRDRRKTDRRSGGRRRPVPPWRQPWAFVGYGVAAALLLVLIFGNDGDSETDPADVGGVQSGTRSVDPADEPPPAAQRPIIDAYTTGAYQRLIAEGEEAEGQRVNAELYCRGLSSVSLRQVESMNQSIADLADSAARVPAAECRWGAEAGGGEDFVLLVPPELAERFAAAPRVTERFVERRRVRGVVEWVGRSDALSLRTAGVLRQLQ